MRALVIEDDVDLREQICAQLRSDGFAVDATGEGEEGLFFALEYPVDIAIVDLGLPRNVDPAISTLPEITLLDLETVRLHAGLDEFAVSDDARALVSHATDTFAAESRELDAVPAISALHRHMADILDAEVARSAARGEGPRATRSATREP